MVFFLREALLVLVLGTTTVDAKVTGTRKLTLIPCSSSAQCKVCEERPCKADDQCQGELQCADAHKTELGDLGVDVRTANCDASTSFASTTFELCYDPATVGMMSISIQELQSPAGEKHSDGVIFAPSDGDVNDGTATGMVWFANNLVVPGTGGFESGTAQGTQTGHCVQVWVGMQLACYFRFDLDTTEGKGTIMAEALFDLVDFPNAELTITGGSGDFLGIVGSGFTSKPDSFDGTTFFYNFYYKILS